MSTTDTHSNEGIGEPGSLGEALNAPLTRRRLLAVGGTAAAAGMLGPLARPLAALAKPGWPSAELTEADALSVNPSQFINAKQFKTWMEELDEIGPAGQRGLRAPGSTYHEQYVETLAGQLERAGVQGISTEPVPFTSWTAESFGLDIVGGEGAGPVNVASYIPCSGQTGPEGVTAPLALIPTGTTPAPESLTGKIAVFDFTIGQYTFGQLKTLQYPGTLAHAPKSKYGGSALYRRTFINQGAAMLAAVKASGAVGMVSVVDYPPDGASGSYFPIDGVLRGIPGLYLDRVAGATVKALAAEEATARLTLPAEVTETSMHNIVGFIPGESSELVTLNTHSDGVNALEENGGAAIVAISQYLSRLPKNALPKTIMVLITAGHMAGGAGSKWFRAQHEEDLVERTNAAITLEHLGSLEWGETADRSAMAPTGNREFSSITAPRSKALVEISARAGLETKAPFVAYHPQNEKATKNEKAWAGEGQYLFVEGGMPDANYGTAPTYLLQWGVKASERIRAQAMRREAIAFTNMALALTRTSRGELRTVNIA
jgi:hypothetical protein